jgi:hypothetical protein
MHIRSILTLAASHLPPALYDQLPALPNVVAADLHIWRLLWVPDDPDESNTAMAEPVPADVLAIQRLARWLDCDLVRFDPEADPEPDLPVWPR